MDRWKAVYAQKTDKRTLAEVIDGADIFLGLSAPNVLTQDMVKRMADKPLVMALANPNRRSCRMKRERRVPMR